MTTLRPLEVERNRSPATVDRRQPPAHRQPARHREKARPDELLDPASLSPAVLRRMALPPGACRVVTPSAGQGQPAPPPRPVPPPPPWAAIPRTRRSMRTLPGLHLLLP